MSQAQLLEALDLLKSGRLELGPQMDRAHEICQGREGSAMYDWIHALVHRIEGDDWNAGYWYRRAGRERHPGPVSEEWQIIRDAVEAG